MSTFKSIAAAFEKRHCPLKLVTPEAVRYLQLQDSVYLVGNREC